MLYLIRLVGIKMKGYWIILVAMGLILANVAVVGVNRHVVSEKGMEAMADEIHFSTYNLRENGEYLNVVMENARYLHRAGEPVLPYYTKTYYFPLGTRVKVECIPESIEVEKVGRRIMPASEPTPLNSMGETKEIIKEEVYASSKAYPDAWYSYNLGGGLVDGKHVTILSLHIYPVRYIPAAGEIQFSKNFQVRIDYSLPDRGMDTVDTYDLVIICPNEWKGAIDTLKQHKESHGVKTLVKTVEDIVATYDGRDGAEKIKYFIKDAIEEYGIKYVLLVGGKKSYFTGNWGYDGPTHHDDSLWYCPVRYVALDDNAEKGYISDLYFADIYDAYGNFSSWDSNGDGIFGAWSFKYGKDTMDFYPDVYVGRLACRSEKELQNVMNKIITYENGNVKSEEWFNRMLLVGGDTFNDADNLPEGEISTEWFYDHYMAGDFDKTSLFVTDGTLTYGHTEPNELAGRFAWVNVIKEFSKGYGFVVFDGHGSPTAWATHFLGHASHTDVWVNGLMTYNMDLLQNKNMPSIFIIGGCHNSEFNISLMDFMNNEWTYQPTYECFGWHIVKMADRGAIASIGNTGLGYGESGGDRNGNGVPDCVEYNGGYIEDRFFEAYGVEGKDVLGETWGTAITNYINTFPPLEDRIDAKTIEEWVLLGDPSLKIGGY